jgi:hypothetical protein
VWLFGLFAHNTGVLTPDDKQCLCKKAIMPVPFSHASFFKTVQNSVYLGYAFFRQYCSKKLFRQKNSRNPPAMPALKQPAIPPSPPFMLKHCIFADPLCVPTLMLDFHSRAALAQ